MISAVQSKLDCAGTMAEVYVNAVLGCIAETIDKGEKVKIARFGVFTPKLYPKRSGINPRTMEKIEVSERMRTKFVRSRGGE